MKKTLQVFNFSIQNAANDAVDIHIDGQIVDASSQQIMKDWWGDDTSVSFKSFRDQVNASNVSTYNIFINSPGGHVGDAMAIHDLIVDLQTKGKTINTKGRGIIASAATYILMAGNTSEMSKNSWFMVHNASGYAFGTVDEVENQARTLRKFNDAIRDFYSNATGLRKEDVSRLMNNETWMTADEAKEKGFVKAVSGDASFQNSIQKDSWNYSNLSVLNSYNAAVKAPQADDHKSYFDNKLEDMKKFFTDIVNGIKGVKPVEGADQTALVNQIADAMSGPLEKVGDEIESTITNKINEGLKGEEVTTVINAAVQTAVENATKDLKQQVTALEKKNSDLETEITNKIGNASNTGKTQSAVTPVGTFKK